MIPQRRPQEFVTIKVRKLSRSEGEGEGLYDDIVFKKCEDHFHVRKRYFTTLFQAQT